MPPAPGRHPRSAVSPGPISARLAVALRSESCAPSEQVKPFKQTLVPPAAPVRRVASVLAMRFRTQVQTRIRYVSMRRSTARMSASSLPTIRRRGQEGQLWVKLRRTQHEQMSSGLALKAGIAEHNRHVSKVPTTDVG